MKHTGQIVNNNAVGFLILSVTMIVLFFSDLIFGSVNVPVSETFRSLFSPDGNGGEWQPIILDFRLPKALTALFAGSALAVSGLLMQTVFRNPLAGPDVLGVSTGAGLGVALTVLAASAISVFDLNSVSGSWMIIIAAWIGSFLIMLLVMAVSIRIKNIMMILVLGILFTSASGAIISILQYFSNEHALKSFVIWTMGSLSNVTGTQLALIAAFVSVGLVIPFFIARRLNLLLPGDQFARSLGVNIRTTRLIVFAGTSLLAGTVTAFCGPIGFVGIAVPHLAKMIFKTANHFVLLPACIMLGSIMMLTGDLISQLTFSNLTLPIGAVTSLLGIPVIIWILFRSMRNNL